MRPIDWQELYAANRAVIEGRRPTSTAKLRLPKGLPNDLRERLAGLAGNLLSGSATAQPGGRGEWVEAAHSGPGGARPYFVYVPPGHGGGRPAPLITMLHGCTQNPASLAAGTLMNLAADDHGFLVVYPQQTSQYNRQGCWNWFLEPHQGRGAGEPAALAAITQAVTADPRWRIDPRQVFVAGMSAGAAMAAVLGFTYPDLFAAVGLHSGVPYGAATGEGEAFATMSRGAARPGDLPRAALRAMGRHKRPVRSIVFHGTEDQIVGAVNGDQAVEQWLAVNHQLSGAALRSRSTSGPATNGHGYTRQVWRDHRGRVLQDYWKVHGLGHAWSGGAAGGSYTDPAGPSASQALAAFFVQQAPLPR